MTKKDKLFILLWLSAATVAIPFIINLARYIAETGAMRP